jgi:hypothetical protein
MRTEITSTYEAYSIVEGFCGYEPSEDEQLVAWAYLIKSGAVWSLQGFYGRTANELIGNGYISYKGDILIDLESC